MSPVSGFPPIEGERATVLVLGSMPGIASLDACAYYAHPRNAFWPILLAWIGGTDVDRRIIERVPYAERVSRLRSSGVAVWDVLASCERAGSLDSAIVSASAKANDIGALAARHPELRRIVFNGRTAEQLYHRHVSSASARKAPSLHRAPSTSPAMATLDLAGKMERWSDAMGKPPTQAQGLSMN